MSINYVLIIIKQKIQSALQAHKVAQMGGPRNLKWPSLSGQTLA